MTLVGTERNTAYKDQGNKVLASWGVPCTSIQASRVLDLVLERYAQRSQLLTTCNSNSVMDNYST